MAWLTLHWSEVLVALLSLLRIVEHFFPSISSLKKADDTLVSLGAKDVDGK